MMITFHAPLLLILVLTASAFGQTADDIKAVRKTLESWNQGWAKRNVELAIQDYDSDVDWTNAFGDRFKGREQLKRGLEFIFSLDFVMAGNSGKNEFEDVKFLGPDIALLRSKLVRKGQKNALGKTMPDRHINHLRVLRRIDGKWKIVSHMISQAQPKNTAKNTAEEKSEINKVKWRNNKALDRRRYNQPKLAGKASPISSRSNTCESITTRST